MRTKFRAFQLEGEGSLFSFYKNGIYTLIEARLPQGGIEVLVRDLKIHNMEQADLLHITSFDNDHCNSTDLIQIINHLRPRIIEVPDYFPDSIDGQLCWRLVHKYEIIHQPLVHNVRVISQEYIRSLQTASPKGTTDIVYESEYNCDNKNDMSLIRLFRSEGFNVLSLGDCESWELGVRLSRCSFLQTEVDVMILPHHGADNGFLTGELLDLIKPKIAICSSNRGNMYGHPTQEIRNLLNSKGIPLYTTKDQDVVVYQDDDGPATVFTFQLGKDNAVQDLTFLPKRFTA